MQNGADWLGYVVFNGLSKSSVNRETSPLMTSGCAVNSGTFLLL